MMSEIEVRMMGALNKLAKWRAVFASWQLGSRPMTDPECQAVRDHREATILLRVEASALAKLLIEHGVFTTAEYQEQMTKEAEALDASFERFFPGFKTSQNGVEMDLAVARKTMAGWRP